jgi:GxxExxY protein
LLKDIEIATEGTENTEKKTKVSDELTEKIIGAAIEVHAELGPGLLESIYEEALCYEFGLQGIKYEQQVPADVVYKGKIIKGQRIDLLVEGEVVVEVKSVSRLPEIAVAQTISYLKATNLKRGLIINFGERRLIDGVKRVSV